MGQSLCRISREISFRDEVPQSPQSNSHSKKRNNHQRIFDASLPLSPKATPFNIAAHTPKGAWPLPVQPKEKSFKDR